jgi:purine-binding chemotaxis protein CheW
LANEGEPQLHDLLLFVAGDRTFGIFSDEVEGTAEAKHPTPLPLAPTAVLGVVYVRGRMLTLLDAAALLSGEALTWPPAVPAIISLRGDEQLALAADSFAGTITISSSDIEVSPHDEEFQTSKAVAGILRHGGQKIIILEPSQLFEVIVQRKDRRRRRF